VELVAVQHGSEVVVAPWVDLHSISASQGSFGCLVATGQLCEMGIGFGILYTEGTSPPADTSRDRKPPESQSMTAGISETFMQTTITVVSEPLFKLSIIAKAGDYLRIINPATVMMAFHRIFTPKCNDLFHGAPAQNHQMWSVEDAFGLWDGNTHDTEPWNVVDTTTRCIVNRSDSVERNLLLALSPHGCVLKLENCCLTCAIAQWRDHVLAVHSRRILCVAGTNLHAGGYRIQAQKIRW